MPRRFLASVLGLLALMLAASATTATAADPTGVQTVDQSAASGQQATAASEATQVKPTNTNISVRVLSPGDNGSVTQTNAVGSTALAGNENETTQLAGQTQAGSGGIQTADQSAGNLQLAGALSAASQYGATNTNLPIRVGSKGDNGDVEQTNAVGSTAVAANSNETDQLAGQKQSGDGGACCHAGGAGIQTSDQSASSAQAAAAKSEATQVKPENVNISVRVLSPGDDGDVEQTNAVDSKAVATNDNDTTQATLQKQGDHHRAPCGCPADTPIQTSDQSSKSVQGATAFSAAKQEDAKNVNLAVRVGSKGDNGDVKQANTVDSTAIAANDNKTVQLSHESGTGRGIGVQTTNQAGFNAQLAASASAALQSGASNANSPIRVHSKGDGGSVHQLNAVDSKAVAANDNKTVQWADQGMGSRHDCKCGAGIGIQATGQKAVNAQHAAALSAAVQDFGKSKCGCPSDGNTNSPVRVGSKGHDGEVKQANIVDSTAIAANDNKTVQLADQTQLGHGGIAIQALGQEAKSLQAAEALSGALQFGASNVSKPVRVGSPGGGGSVVQANDVHSGAFGVNDNSTKQLAGQAQFASGHCGCAPIAIQALGQSAFNLQAAKALSAAFQVKPKNTNAPTSVWSDGGAGSLLQLNAASSAAAAPNWNGTLQLARQLQA